MTRIRDFMARHPQMVNWIALAIGMVLILLWAAKDVDLLPSQRGAMVAATIGLAGMCVWILGWED